MSDTGSKLFNVDREALTGKERLLRMYSLDEFGSLSPELLGTYQATFFGTFLGCTYGGLMKMRNIKSEVVESKRPKEAIAFKSQYQTSRRTPNIPIMFMKGAFFWGWRIGVLSGSVILISSSTSVYRGKSGILEYIIAGGMIGTLSQVKHGIRSMGGGAVLGTIMGTVGGCIAYGITQARGETTEETDFWRSGWKGAQLKPTEVVKKFREEQERLVRDQRVKTVKSEDERVEFTADETERQALVWR